MTDPDELETRWPQVVGRFVLWGMLGVVLYFLSIGPLYFLMGCRWRAVDGALWQIYAPLRHADLERYLGPYKIWWARLPGGVYERVKAHPERFMWTMELMGEDYKTRTEPH